MSCRKDGAGRYRGFPERIALGDYARLLFETTLSVDVEEFHLALLAELGFGDAVQSLIATEAQRFAPDLAEKIIDVARLRSLTGERVLLILRDPPPAAMIGDEKVVLPAGPTSPFSGWPPSAQHAVCPVFAGTRQWLLPPFLLPLVTMVVIDGLANAPAVFFAPSASVVRVLTSADLAESPSLTPVPQPLRVYPEVMDPKSLDEAISQARRIFSSPSSPSGPQNLSAPPAHFESDEGPSIGPPHPKPMA
jgi:hypothetical protein